MTVRRNAPGVRGALRALLAAVLVTAGPGSAGISRDYYNAMQGEAGVVADLRHSVLVVTVKKVDDGPFTNGNPPTGVVEVNEVLRGDALQGTALKATWRPFPHGVDYGAVEKDPRVIAWKKVPVPSPKAGEKLVVAGTVADGAISIAPMGAYPFSEEKRKWAMGIVEKARKRPSK